MSPPVTSLGEPRRRPDIVVLFIGAMLDMMRALIREAVAEMPRAQHGVAIDRGSNWGKSIDRMYFDRDRLISLCRKYIKRYGFVKADERDTSTYERILHAIKLDPTLEDVESDMEFSNAFMEAAKKREILGTAPLLLAKVLSALHSPNVKVMNLKPVLAAVSSFMEKQSMSKSQHMDVDKEMLFFKLKLKKVYDNSTTINPKWNTKKGDDIYVFQDQRGNYFYKHGAPPAVYMRVGNGGGKTLTMQPYEMHLNDVYTFRGKVVKTYENSKGAIVNVIDSVQPA